MYTPEEPEDPPQNREDRRDEPYADVMQRLGLGTPQGPSEAYPEGIVSRDAHQLAHLAQAALEHKCKPDCDYDEHGEWKHSPLCKYF